MKMLIHISCIVFFTVFPNFLWAEISILVVPVNSGGWVLNIDSSDLEGVVGSNLIDEYISAGSIETITVGGTVDSLDSWVVQVKKEDIFWNSTISFSVLIESTGTGNGDITTSEDYQVITNTYQTLFSGTGDRDNITVRFKIGGISISEISANEYKTDIVYTIVDQ